jgi:hypothetical protein
MESQVLLPCSQQPVSDPYPEPDESGLQLLQPLATSSLLGPNIFLSTLFFNILSVFFP